MGAFISKQLPPLLRRTEGTAALDVARSGYGNAPFEWNAAPRPERRGNMCVGLQDW